MLLDANILQTLHGLGVLGCVTPLLSGRHANRDWLLRFNIKMHIPGWRARPVSWTGVIVSRVQTYDLIVARDPVERLLLAKRRHWQGARKEQHTQVCPFHGYSSMASLSPYRSRYHVPRVQALLFVFSVGTARHANQTA